MSRYTTLHTCRRDAGAYQSHMIYLPEFILDGHRTWPALWEVGTSWETDGEIDILEGVNDKVSTGTFSA